MKEYKIGMVAAEFNFEVTSLMIERAKAEAEFLGVKIVKTILVPGVFEIPMAVKKMLESDDIDAVITLGAVITGETKHDEVVVAQSSRKIMDLGLEYNKPVGFGITGPGMTELQAMDRIEKGREVVDAVVKMLQRLDYSHLRRLAVADSVLQDLYDGGHGDAGLDGDPDAALAGNVALLDHVRGGVLGHLGGPALPPGGGVHPSAGLAVGASQRDLRRAGEPCVSARHAGVGGGLALPMVGPAVGAPDRVVGVADPNMAATAAYLLSALRRIHAVHPSGLCIQQWI